MIYLDNAATTGKKPDEVLQTLTKIYQSTSVNAGRGSYTAAQDAVRTIDDCKVALLKLCHITSGYHVYFSPSATISLNGIILGLPLDTYSNVYVTPFEHNAVMRPLHAMCRKSGAEIHVLPFQRDTWQVDMEAAESMFMTNRPDFVFLSMVSNTTGYLLPVKELTQLAHTYGARVIVDCAQAMGAVEIQYADISADAYVFAGHKTLYGPYGIAGTILKDDFHPEAGLFGGTGSDSLNLDMPSPAAGGYEPGSANVPAIYGLHTSVQWLCDTGVSAIEAKERTLIRLFEEEAAQNEKIHLYMPPVNCRTGIAAFTVEGYKSHEVGEILDDEFEIAVRTGYQCAPLVHDWLGTRDTGGVVRMSVSYFNTEEEIRVLLKALKTL